jgi:putative endopeptidase
MNDALAQSGLPVPDAESFAYAACNHLSTFSIVLAKNYVDEALGADAKTRLTKLSQDLVNTYKDLMGSTPWLGSESQTRVIDKLDHITLNVLEPSGGYYDFSGVELTPTEAGGTLLGNYFKLKQYRLDQESKMVGKPAVPACPWFYVEPTITNAFYDPVSNSVNILPGFVTSLVYTDDMSEQDLLAGIGFTVGHEISHGFDYQGAQFDAYGTPNPLFTDADIDAFVLKASSLASYYKTLEVAPGLMVNGENVVTEAAADLCGMQAVLELAGKSEGINYDAFFKKNANIWEQVVPEAMLPTLILDAHTLHNQRVNVNAQMFDPIYEHLGIKEGDTMYLAPENRINIWGPNA